MAKPWTGWRRSATSNTRPFEGNQGGTMTDKTGKKIWFITGAARGMGVDFAKAALAAGHTVVATGRDRSEEHTSELQSRLHLVCRLLLEKKKKKSQNVVRSTSVRSRVYGYYTM